MKAKRAMAIFLICLLTLSTVACSGNTEIPETIPTETAAETEPEDTGYKADYLPDVTYDGYQYRIVCYAESPKDITEPTGDIVDDAIYSRNMLLEERYNIEFVTSEISTNDYKDMETMIKNAATAQTDDFDLCVLVMQDAYNSVLNGYAPTMDKLPYADMSQPWYYQTLNDKFTFDGISLLGVTAYDLDPGGTCIIFNKNMIEMFTMESPYDMVRNGTWTMENM